MSDFIPKSNASQAGGIKIGGLSRKAQKLQALRDKAAQQNSDAGSKPHASAANSSVKAKDSFANSKKTTFQRKAV